MSKVFDKRRLKNLYIPSKNSSGGENGQVTIIGGSYLFHGAALLSLKVASRICDMVFFATPEKSVGHVAEQMKSKLLSFIWVPWDEIESYIAKSDAVLIGPGFLRFGKEKTPENLRGYANHAEGKISREITGRMLKKFPGKSWVIDAGSLQTMDPEWIPENAILTPNNKEFQILFKVSFPNFNINEVAKTVEIMARKYNCVIAYKGPTSVVATREETVLIEGGNPGMTKGGTGDVLAGLTVALLAKNDPFLAAASASYILKAAADELYKEVGTTYNADDLANRIPGVFKKLLNQTRALDKF